MSTFVVAGASGFVGRCIVERLLARGDSVIALGRDWSRLPPVWQTNSRVEAKTYAQTSDARPDVAATFADIDVDLAVVINAAGVAHNPRATQADYLRGITDFTRDLAEATARRGSARLINISSIAARSPAQSGRQSLRWYGEAKRAAEREIDEVSARSGLPAVSLRPPAVWGPGAPGAFSTIRGLLLKGMPLPIGAVRTRRSYIHVQSLVDEILRVSSLAALPHFPRSHVILEVSDGTYTLSEITTKVAQELSVPARIFWFPLFALRLASGVVGNQALSEAISAELLLDGEQVNLLESSLQSGV